MALDALDLDRMKQVSVSFPQGWSGHHLGTLSARGARHTHRGHRGRQGAAGGGKGVPCTLFVPSPCRHQNKVTLHLLSPQPASGDSPVGQPWVSPVCA